MSQEGGAQEHLGLGGSYYVGLGTADQRPSYDPDLLPWVAASADTSSPEWEKAPTCRC